MERIKPKFNWNKLKSVKVMIINNKLESILIMIDNSNDN